MSHTHTFITHVNIYINDEWSMRVNMHGTVLFLIECAFVMISFVCDAEV